METTEKTRVLSPSTVKKIAGKKMTLSFSLKNGKIGLSYDMFEGLKDTSSQIGGSSERPIVQFVQDMETPKNWYIKAVTKDGFPITVGGAKYKTYSMNSIPVVSAISESLKLDDSFSCKVSPEFETDSQSPFFRTFAIITSSAVVKDK